MTVPVSRRNFLQRTAASLLSVPGLAVLGGCSQVTLSQSGNGITGTLPQPTAPILSGSSPEPGALSPDSLISEDEEMLSPQRASQISTLSFGQIQFPRFGAYVDSTVVLPNRHWIVLSASLFVIGNGSKGQLAGIPIGGPLNGIFIAPSRQPLNAAGSVSTPYRVPVATDYPLNIAQYTFWDAGPTDFPLTGGEDNPLSAGSLQGDTFAMFSNGPFYVPANWRVRGMLNTPNDDLSGVSGLSMVLNLQLIDEANC